MKETTYIAVFDPTKAGYSEFLPDLPGVFTVVKNII